MNKDGAKYGDPFILAVHSLFWAEKDKNFIINMKNGEFNIIYGAKVLFCQFNLLTLQSK